MLKHYNLPNSYYSFNFGNIHFLALDTQLEFSFNIFKPEDEEEKEENIKHKESNIMNGKSYATTLADLLAKYNITAEIPPGYLLNDKMIVENIPFDTEQYKFVVNDLRRLVLTLLLIGLLLCFISQYILHFQAICKSI